MIGSARVCRLHTVFYGPYVRYGGRRSLAPAGLKCFVAAVFGGIGSIPGAVVGGLLSIIGNNACRTGILHIQRRIYVPMLIIMLLCRPTALREKSTDKV